MFTNRVFTLLRNILSGHADPGPIAGDIFWWPPFA